MLVAMAGVLSGVFHAPLTGIFLIAEISGGYGLIIPLMIVASFSFLIVKFFHPESMEIKKLKKVGAFISEDKDVSILGRIEIKDLIEDGFFTLTPEDSLGNIIELVKHSKQNIFPVVNKKQKLLGTIELDNIRQDMFNPLLYDKVIAHDILEKASIKITMNENIFSVMKKFDESGKWELPVVDKHGEYRGFLSKSAILSKYRNELIVSFN
jgi:CIC family chloride channel protein